MCRKVDEPKIAALLFATSLSAILSHHLRNRLASLQDDLQRAAIEAIPISKLLRSTALVALLLATTAANAALRQSALLAHDRGLQSRHTKNISNDHKHHSIDNPSQTYSNEGADVLE